MIPGTEVIVQFVRQGDGSRSEAFTITVIDLLEEIENKGMHEWPDEDSELDQFLILILFKKDEGGEPLSSTWPLMATQNFYSVVYENLLMKQEESEDA